MLRCMSQTFLACEPRHLGRGVVAELLSPGAALEFFAHKAGPGYPGSLALEKPVPASKERYLLLQRVQLGSHLGSAFKP